MRKLFHIASVTITAIVFVCSAAGQNSVPRSLATTATIEGPCEQVRRAPLPNYPTTLVRIMPSRYRDLTSTLEGYRRSGVPLVSFGPEGYRPAGYGDDLGIYYLIPVIGRVFRLDLPRSISIFFAVSFVICFAIGGLGFMFLAQTGAGRLIAGVALVLLAPIVYHLGDVYLYASAMPVLLFPWCLYLLRKGQIAPLSKFLFSAGLALGTTWLIRTDAAIPTLVFLVAGICFHVASGTRRKAVLLLVLLAGVAVPRVLFRSVTSQRDRFLVNQGVNAVDLERHTFWHLAYIGLGYVTLPGMPSGTCDEVGKLKVSSFLPNAEFLTKAYDNVLRTEALKLMRTHPAATLVELLAKLSTTLLIILIFANLGLLAAYVYPKPQSLEFAFWSALAIASIPVIIVVPSWQYLVGVIGLSTVYGVVSIDHAFWVRQLKCTAAKKERVAIEAHGELDVECHPV